MRIWRAAIATFFVAFMANARAWALEIWPAHALTLVVPHEAGGLTDQLTRLLAEPLSERLGVRVITAPRAGAGGLIAALSVAQARPDGYTMLIFNNTVLYAAAAAPEPRPDLLSRLRPVAYVAGFPNALVVHPSVPAQTPVELLAYLRVNGSRVVCGALSDWGDGCRALSEAVGQPIAHLSYGGRSGLNADLRRGVVRMALTPLPGLIVDARLRVLAVSTAERLPRWPELPTMREAGIPFELLTINAVYAPMGTPDHIVQRVSAEVAHIMTTEPMRSQLDRLGGIPGPADIPAVDARFRAEWDRAEADRTRSDH